MIKLFSTGCPLCKIIKKLLDDKGIKYEEINDINIIQDIAKQNNINNVPFAEIDTQIYNTQSLREWVNNYKEEK